MFPLLKALINHKENCITINGTQAIKMPEANDMVHFKNYHKGPEAPLVIYADSEAINPILDGGGANMPLP